MTPLVVVTMMMTTLAATSGRPAATVRHPGEIVWLDAPVAKGAKIAVLWGDPKTGAYGCFKKFPAGTVLPLHTHAHEQRTVVLSGTVTFKVGGLPDQELGPQAYSLVPAGIPHAATCGPKSECVVFEEQPGPADFLPAEPPAPQPNAQ